MGGWGVWVAGQLAGEWVGLVGWWGVWVAGQLAGEWVGLVGRWVDRVDETVGGWVGGVIV